MKKEIIAQSILFSFILLLVACGPKKELVNESSTTIEKTTDKDCPKDIICTMDYRTISVTIKDKKGNPVILDNYTAALVGTAKSLIAEKAIPEYLQSKGTYIIAEDNSMNIVGKQGKEVEFVGYQNGKELVRSTFIIGHDCCHIKLMRGEREITIE